MIGFLSRESYGKALESISEERVPPIGKRIYIIDEKPNLTSSEIKSISHSDPDIPHMKDPKTPNFETQRLVVRKMKKPEPKKLGIKPVVLNFSNLRIKGNFTQPRVRFQSEYLKLQRADESLKKNFFGKIYQVADEEF